MRTKHFIMSAIIALVSLVAAPALAGADCSQTGIVLDLVGLDSTDGKIFAGVTSSNDECSCSYFRFNPEYTDTAKALSILMVAKVSGIRVRIDIADPANCDSATRVYLQQP